MGEWRKGELVSADLSHLNAAFESSKREYLRRDKTILEQIMNYSTTGFEDGSAEIFWVQGKGGDKCVLKPVIAPQTVNMVPHASVDIRNFNQSGFRIKTEGEFRVFGDEQTAFVGPSRTVIERLQRAWGLAFKECPSNQKRAF
jgi:hypothetical protein